MKPVFLLCLSQLRKKKIQNMSIAIIIMLSTLLLTTSVVVMNNTGDVFRRVHQQVNGSQQLLNFENGLYDPDAVHDWWAKQSGVDVSELFKYRSLSTFTHENEEISNITLYLTDAGESPRQSKVDKLIFVKGAETERPARGEAWIPTSLAYSKGIAVGDQIGVKTNSGVLTLKVSALVIDVPFSQPFTVTARIWLNTEDFKKSMLEQGQSEKAIMGLRFHDPNLQQVYWQRFEQDFGAPFLETMTDYDGMASFYLITGKVISFIMILLAFIMMMVALYTIGFIISDAILSNYKNIGILRSLGFAAEQTVSVYMLQYGVLAVMGILPGLFISYYFSRTIVALTLSYLKTDDLIISMKFPAYAAVAGGGILLLILLTAFLFAQGARKIKPAQAIRYGMSEAQQAKSSARLKTSRSGFSWLDRISPIAVISMRRIVGNRGSSLLIACMSIITTAVLISGAIFMSSLATMNPPEWGYDNADITLEVLDGSKLPKDRLAEDLREDSRVRNISNIGGVYGVIPSAQAGESGSAQTGVYITSVSGDLDKLGLKNIAGRNPRNESEISIGVQVSKLIGKGVGDPMDVYIQGKRSTYTVVGVYQAITNKSVSARLASTALEKMELHSQSSGSLYLLNLDSGASADQFVKDVSRKYGDAVYVAAQKTLIKETFSQAMNILLFPMAVMGLFVIIAIFGITSSISRIYVKKESRTYGIYKSMGMTSAQIRLSIALSTLLLAVIGALIGLPLGVLGFPNMLNSILSGYGIVQFPTNIDWFIVLSVLPAGLLVVVAGTWISSRLVKKKPLRFLLEG